MAVSCCPTEFALHGFDPDGLDVSIHNVFDACARQVRPDRIASLSEGAIGLISGYDVDRAVVAVRTMPRVFVRSLFSHCALTSRKTTLNPARVYDHSTHVTSGAIPEHLQ